MKKIIIFGIGGGSRDVLGIINDINTVEKKWEVVGFVGKDDEKKGETIDGFNVLEFDKLPVSDEYYSICSVADPTLKKKIITMQINKKGYKLATLIHPKNYISDDLKVEPGSVIFSAVRISYNVTIGEAVWIDSNANIGHNVSIGNYTSIMPMSVVLGPVGDCCLIGAGSIIHQKITIGNDSFVGMGTIVAKDIPNKTKIINFPRNVITNQN